jgi:hypothetical protein
VNNRLERLRGATEQADDCLNWGAQRNFVRRGVRHSLGTPPSFSEQNRTGAQVAGNGPAAGKGASELEHGRLIMHQIVIEQFGDRYIAYLEEICDNGMMKVRLPKYMGVTVLMCQSAFIDFTGFVTPAL